jgi:hypothetical protein
MNTLPEPQNDTPEALASAPESSTVAVLGCPATVRICRTCFGHGQVYQFQLGHGGLKPCPDCRKKDNKAAWRGLCANGVDRDQADTDEMQNEIHRKDSFLPRTED